jgi:transcriptional regulator with GAF, ATPase, and Fis domain
METDNANFGPARHGTMLLDEVGDLLLEMQLKLLRVIEEKELERIGDSRSIRSDFRLIPAGNRNLEKTARPKIGLEPESFPPPLSK